MADRHDIRVTEVSKRFGHRQALEAVSLAVPRGAFVTLLGPSGCGKTTLLRIIGGFETPDSGTVSIRGEEMDRRPPHQRPTAMVFQRYALFPHMTVADNIGFGLKMHRLPKPERDARIARMLELVDLSGYGGQYPDTLSGGQQQRVALARALVVEPTVLLLDEPLGALDMSLRRQMQAELKTIQQRTGITFVSVTHDQEEALVMSDQVVVMNAGQVEQADTPETVFARPATRFVAEFMGARVHDLPVTSRTAATATVRLGGVDLTLPARTETPTVAVTIRPERVRLAADGAWQATVAERAFKGSTTSLRLLLPDGLTLDCDVPTDRTDHLPAIGERVSVALMPDDLWLIPAREPATVEG